MSISPAWSGLAASGKFQHAPAAQQGIPRPNRDTLYSFAIVDLDAGRVAITLNQERSGTFEIPDWDAVSLTKIKAALLQLGTTVSDTRRMFGANERQVDPVKHLIGSAMLWGGLPEKDALYLPITPARNDGKTVYKLTVGNVPVDGFWSLTVYNNEGYLQPNPDNVYSVNSHTAKEGPDGSVSIQFGGCEAKAPNCLPITQGWNYTVRLFLPRREILDGSWRFPEAKPVR